MSAHDVTIPLNAARELIAERKKQGKSALSNALVTRKAMEMARIKEFCDPANIELVKDMLKGAA